MTKKFFVFLLCAVLLFVFSGCNDPVVRDECPEPEECPAAPEVPGPKDLTPSPTVTREVYHWVPGAIEAKVTAKVDLKNAKTHKLIIANTVLKDFIDYEIDGTELIIYGSALEALRLDLGKHEVTLVTEHGSTDFEIDLVADASLGESIKKTTIKTINMGAQETFNPTAVIASAPDLLISEIGVDMGEYSYFEVFNNTNAAYNLKNHRIVFSNLTLQTMLASKGIFEQPLGMAAAVYIDEDTFIPALSTAVIWVVGSYPWKQGTEGVRPIIENDDVQSHIFGDKPENLSIAKFRNVYGLSEDVQVIPLRPQFCIFNGVTLTESNLYGTAPIKAASTFSGFSSSTADRGLQIQKFDVDKKISVTDIEGVSYYKYDIGVLNKEEDVYVDGVLDHSKIEVYGRETINALYARIAYYDSEDKFVGFETLDGIDLYNANKPTYLKMYEEIVTPIVSALIYANLTLTEGSLVSSKFGEFRSLEFTVPAADSILMKYVPLVGAKTLYESFFSNEKEGLSDAQKALNTYKLSGVGAEVTSISAEVDTVVPLDPAYPRDYLKKNYNTIGRGIGANYGK